MTSKSEEELLESAELEADIKEIKKSLSLPAKKSIKEVEEETQSLLVKADEARKSREREKLSKFPCCFHIPLDIVMIGFGIFDVIYYTCFALMWVILVAVEPFAGRDLNVRRNKTITEEHLRALKFLINSPNPEFNSEYDNEEGDGEYQDIEFAEPSSTTAPDKFDLEEFDAEKSSRIYSRIANHYQEFGQEIDNQCGKNYYEDYLFTHNLDITRDLFEDLARHIISGCILHAAFAGLLLTNVCCFRGHKTSKFIIILLWYGQVIPVYFFMQAMVMSQSQRLCIFQYGMGLVFRGQTVLFVTLLLPIIIYKSYEIFIWSNYIRKFFMNNNADLTDESFYSTFKIEQREKRRLDQDLTATEAQYDYKHRYRPYVREKLFRKIRHHHPQPGYDNKGISRLLLPWYSTQINSPLNGDSSSD